MNRTLLLENLPDLLEDLDARLTALEAKPQAPESENVNWKAKYNNALAAQLDDLRNVNAKLRAAIEAVEYDGEFGTCLWCSSLYGYEHFQNCQRQAALR